MEKFEDSVYNKAFLFFKRPSCNECLFKVDKFVADILGGDFHAAKPGTVIYNENGVSSLLVLTARGEKLLHENGDFFYIKEVGIQESTHQAAINHPLKKRANRNQFSSTFVSKGLKAAGGLTSVRIIEFYDRFVKDIKVAGVRIKKVIR